MKTVSELRQNWRELAQIAQHNPSDEAAQETALDAFNQYLSAGLAACKEGYRDAG